jgi:hypothetical protein
VNIKFSLLVLTMVGFLSCNEMASKKQSEPPAPQTAQTDSTERATCDKHQLRQGGCGEYKVLSYDATWENRLGNKGAFVLEREGLTINAHCGSDDCSEFSEAVGKTVIADKSIGDLIIHHEPLCEDPLYVKTALEAYKRNTGRDGSVGTICQTTLIVEKVEAKPMPRN